MSARASGVRIWLQLFRAPNLFTVPGDPLAGYLVANSGFVDWRLPVVIFASLCFYAAGLLMNDLADVAEDRLERPTRPLPSGAAAPGTVRLVLWSLNAMGLAALAGTAQPAAFIAGLAVVAGVWSYNRVTKRIPVLGALNMGACRAGSVLIGAFAGPLVTWQMGLIPAAMIGLYIAAVTHLARYETHPRVPVIARLLPFVALLLTVPKVVSYALLAPAKSSAAVLLGAAGVWVLWLAICMFKRPAPFLPPLIGAHIRVLLVLQAAICWFADPWEIGPWAAAVLLAMWPISTLVSRRFYAS